MKTTQKNLNRRLQQASAAVLVVSLLLALPVVARASSDGELYSFLERFHGHTCAGSLFGLRLGLAAKAALQPLGKTKARYFDHSCPVDGIQVGAGTTYGNRAIEIEDRDQQRLILTDEGSGRQVEATLTEKAVEMGKSYRQLSGKRKELPSGSPEQPRLAGEVAAILSWFRTAPDAEILTVRRLK